VSEFSSSQNIKANNINSKNNDNRSPFPQGQGLIGVQNNRERFQGNFLYEDVYRANSSFRQVSKSNPVSFLNRSTNIDQNIRNIFAESPINRMNTNPILSAINTGQQNILSFFNNAQINSQAFLSNFLNRFVDISDRIAAFFGEREKDLRDRLSDTYKRIEIKVYEIMGKIDTSMEQKDHNKEKKYKGNEEIFSEDGNIEKIH
jgi:hypothetical protein